MSKVWLGRKKLYKLGGSKAVVIPLVCLENWSREIGSYPKEVDLFFEDGVLKIIPAQEGDGDS